MSLLIGMSHRPNSDTILLLREHQELNDLIKMTICTGLESKYFLEIIAPMRKLEESGFRKVMHYCVDYSSDFIQAGSAKFHPEVSPFSMNQMAFSEVA